MSRPTLVWPGPARLTLVLMAAVPAAMAYPWQSARERWVLGVAVAAALVLLSWWRGLHLTTLLRRRLAMLRRGGDETDPVPGADVRATAVLRVGPRADGVDADELPLRLIAGYLDRYGVKADAVRITSRDTGNDAPARETWIGLTLSAADNLAALQARSPRIPLHKTAEVAVRRLADHLREDGWQVSGAEPQDIPPLFAPDARETWRGLRDGETGAGYVAAYQVAVDAALADTLAEIRSQRALEIWTAVEITGTATDHSVVAACAFRTAGKPAAAAPLAGLIPQHGNHRVALRALSPGSVHLLGGRPGRSVPPDLAAAGLSRT